MCFDHDSRPPIPPIAGAAVDGARVTVRSEDGTEFAAYHARPEAAGKAALLILPDVRGLHPFYEELALRLAETGVEALAIDYFGRTAGTAPRGADFEHSPHVEQTHYVTLLADAKAGRDVLAAEESGRRMLSMGFCFGGRLAFLSATRPELKLAGAIGFYGSVAGPGRAGMPAPVDLAADVSCPILGLFGGDDQSIPDQSIAAYSLALESAGVDHDLVVYPGAPHSFFDRKADSFASASDDAWRHVLAFIERVTSL